jgi:large subunit ribosomal protein L3
MKYILGKKIGMTRIYNEKGKVQPVTIVEAGPIFVTQINDKPSGPSIQVGYEETKKLNKPEKGHLLKNSIEKSLKHLQEFKINADNLEKFKLGQAIDVTSFEIGDKINISGISKGKGFAGTVKRHNFTTGPKTHGSHNYRRPGSIGSAYPERVIKGRKMAGHMGAEKVTVKNLKVIDIIPDNNLLIVLGAIPGNRGSLVTIKGVK